MVSKGISKCSWFWIDCMDWWFRTNGGSRNGKIMFKKYMSSKR